MNKSFFKSLEKRRSIYTLGKNIKVDDFKIEQLLMDALKVAPSAFNSQSARLILLLGVQHHILWQKTLDILKQIVPKERQRSIEDKIKSFADAYGTVLFFEDEKIIKDLKKQYPTYHDKFDIWAEQGNAILQYIVWCLLANENIGASLQHYNPLIDAMVHNEWHTDKSWRLIAQMPFGSKIKKAEQKQVIAPEKRMRIFT